MLILNCLDNLLSTWFYPHQAHDFLFGRYRYVPKENFLQPRYQLVDCFELEKVVKNHTDGIKLIALTFIAGSPVYGRMAADRTDPAEWYDITETGSLLFSATRRAAGL